jgi:membrane protein involved in colicin uptake
MADEKTFSENEHLAILADRVTKETANLTAERDQLVTQKTELENKLDVEATAKSAAEQRADEAEKALADFKAEIESQREAAAKKDERVAKAREVAGHLADDFFEDETRLTRIVAMSDEIFEGYLADLGAASKSAPKTNTTTIPRETAMAGAGAEKPSASSGRDFFLRGYVAPQEG